MLRVIARQSTLRRLEYYGGRRWMAAVQPAAQGGGSDTALALKQNALLSKEDRQALILSPPALVVTREYEWGNILLGFEQANKYSIRSAPGGEIVGYIAEENSLGRSITRNFLRTHRSFKATVLDSSGEPFFVLRRPFYVFSTSMFVESPEGDTMGEIHMDWHLWRRRYNMYVDKNQFARVDSGFLGVDFDMKDENDSKIATVNKDFTGFAREIFTDARQYVVRLQPDYSGDDLSPDANVQMNIKPSPDEIMSEKQLTRSQKATILACAVSIDFDYFSLHSGSAGGVGLPFMAPIPTPVPSGGAVEQGAASDVAGGAVAGAVGEAVTGDPIGGESQTTPSGFPDQAFNEQADPGAGDQSQWATFEAAEPDFSEPEFAEDTSDFDGEGGSGVMDVFMGFFTDGDD